MQGRTRSIAGLLVAAALAAGGIALLVWLSGEPAGTGRETGAPIGLDPSQLPPPLGGAPSGRTLDPRVLGPGEQAVIQRTDPQTGRLIQEFASERLIPRQEGVFDVVRPQARLYLSAGRVIHLRSERGRFVIPANHPQSGEFRDDVTITVYQPRGGGRGRGGADLGPESEDRVVTIHLDRASFDTTLGEVRSDSALSVLASLEDGRVRFDGRGLKLLYNQLDRRIDYLEVTEGDALTYTPHAAAAAAAGDRPDGEPDDPTGAAGSATGAEDEPPQHYRVTLEGGVRVRREERTIDAERLVALFTMDRGLGREAPEGEPPNPDGIDEAAEARPESGNERPLRVEGSELRAAAPVTMTWSGRLLMEPLDAAPPQMAAPRDLFLRFSGSPVIVSLGEDDRLLCGTLDYLDSTRTVTAAGGGDDPLRLHSPDLGTLLGRRLALGLETDEGRIDGPGSIRAAAPGSGGTGILPVDRPAPGSGGRGLPPGLSIVWSEGVDFAFSDLGGADARIESATFHGDVRVSEPRFDMRGERLALILNEGADAQRQLEALAASGGVEVATGTGSIRAEELRIDTAPNEGGRLTPRRLTASGDVRLEDPTQSLRADDLRLDLGRRSATGIAEAAAGDTAPSLEREMEVEVRHLLATGDVRLMLDDGTVTLGDRLEASPPDGEATLYGSPVRISRGGDPIRHMPRRGPPDDPGDDRPPHTEVELLQLHLSDHPDHGAIAASDGAGTFIYTEAQQQEADAAGRRIAVTWRDRMVYADSDGAIRLFGAVRAEAEDSPTELNRLEAGRMTLKLAEAEGTGDEGGAEGERTATEGSADSSAAAFGAIPTGGELERLTAERGVVLLATMWADPSRQRVLRRFRLEGPTLSFDNIAQVADIEGGGSMLVEDYRPTEREGEDGAMAADAMTLSGRGATLFTWRDRWTLDKGRQDMVMEGRVEMTHQPAGREGTLELTADRLAADLASTDRLRPMGMTRSDPLEIREIEATGRVRVRDAEHLVTADRLRYDGEARMLTLSAAPGDCVVVTRLSDPRPLRAEVILWNLKTNRFEAREASR